MGSENLESGPCLGAASATCRRALRTTVLEGPWNGVLFVRLPMAVIRAAPRDSCSREEYRVALTTILIDVCRAKGSCHLHHLSLP